MAEFDGDDLIARTARLLADWDLATARDLVQEALDDPHLDPVHGLAARRLLAQILRESGDLTEAYDLAEAVAHRSERTLGPRHPETVQALAVLAAVRHDFDELDDAEALYHRVLDSGVDEDAPTPCARAVRLARVNLALLHRDRGDRGFARTTLSSVYAAHRRLHGADDLDTIRIAAELAVLHREDGDMATARRLLTIAHAASRGRLGHRHPLTRALEWELGAVEPQVPGSCDVPEATSDPVVVDDHLADRDNDADHAGTDADRGRGGTDAVMDPDHDLAGTDAGYDCGGTDAVMDSDHDHGGTEADRDRGGGRHVDRGPGVDAGRHEGGSWIGADERAAGPIGREEPDRRVDIEPRPAQRGDAVESVEADDWPADPARRDDTTLRARPDAGWFESASGFQQNAITDDVADDEVGRADFGPADFGSADLGPADLEPSAASDTGSQQPAGAWPLPDVRFAPVRQAGSGQRLPPADDPAEAVVPAQAVGGRRRLPVRVAVPVGLGVLALVLTVAVLTRPAGEEERATPAVSVTPSGPITSSGGPLDVQLRDEGTALAVRWSGARAAVIVALSRAGAPAVVLASVPADTREYVVRGVEPDVEYCVVVGPVSGHDSMTRATSVCTGRRPAMDGQPGR